MFVVEISFTKTGQQSEIIYVKRPHFIIGSTQDAHVIVDEMASLGYSLHFVKGKGNSFFCYTLSNNDLQVKNELSETFYGVAKLDLSDYSLYVVAIDNDLLLRRIDVNNKNVLKILRKATLTTAPVFPAIVIFHEKPIVCSIEAATEILLGRSQDCHIRIDAEGVDNIHCKLIYENSKFWIEDEMSQGGVYVDGEKITTKVGLPPCKYFSLAGGINIMGINSDEQLLKIGKCDVSQNEIPDAQTLNKYPCIISKSSLVRPGRVQILPGKEVLVGRAPENDVWIGSPHISRTHLRISCDLKSEITLVDNSSNGSVCDGMLISGNDFRISKSAHIIDLGDSIILGICYSQEDEELFYNSDNSVREFLRLVKERENKSKIKVKLSEKISNKFKKVFEIYLNMDKKGKFGFGFVLCLGMIFLILVVRLIVELAK